MALLESTGVDEIFVLPFDKAMATLSAREFMEHVLQNQLGVSILVIGYDHRFGRPLNNPLPVGTNSSHDVEGFHAYQSYGRALGIDVVLAKELEGEHISSSVVRKALATGDVAEAAHLLGRPYTWSGCVVHGHAVGRQLGFPTANLQAIAPDKQLPANGAYAVRVSVGAPGEPVMERAAMLNIGHRPTLDNGSELSIEANLLDFRGNLYGQTLTLSFIARLRAEQCFSSEEHLRAQLEKDRAVACQILCNH